MTVLIVTRPKVGTTHTILFEDDALLDGYQWMVLSVNRIFYAVVNNRDAGGPNTIYMHRLILPTELEVDHRNGNGLDNRRSNLREATKHQQHGNQRLSRVNKSGYKGVSFDWRTGRWVARCAQVWGGRWDTPEQAAMAYNELAIDQFGEFAAINHIPEVPDTGHRVVNIRAGMPVGPNGWVAP